MQYCSVNGQIISLKSPALQVSNRAYKYGLGCFETIRVVNGRIPLFNFHYQRLVESSFLLRQSHLAITETEMRSQIIDLCKENNCLSDARVRFTYYGGNGGLNESGDWGYTIEAEPLPEGYKSFSKSDCRAILYSEQKKMRGKYAGIKSTNYLLYILAKRYALENGFQEAIIVNDNNHIIETSIGNVFFVKNNALFTPPLSSGCVDGVMRKYLMRFAINNGMEVLEKDCVEEDLVDADEIFYTNALVGIQSITEFGGGKYEAVFSEDLYTQIIEPLFSTKASE